MSKTRLTTIGVATVAATMASLMMGAPAAHADESGISGGISVTARGSGGYVSNTYAKVSSVSPYLSFYGFYRVFGPDYSSTSPTQKWGQGIIWNVPVGRSYANGQKHCAEGWERQSDGTFRLLGRPCVENPV